MTGGTLLLSLAATDSYHLKGLVDENEIARIAIGQPARIRTEAFADLEELATRCRYRSCQHDGDEGCAIDDAVAEGQLTERRVNSWIKLKLEAVDAKRRHERHLTKKARERQRKTLARIDERDRWRSRRGKRRRRRCRGD